MRLIHFEVEGFGRRIFPNKDNPIFSPSNTSNLKLVPPYLSGLYLIKWSQNAGMVHQSILRHSPSIGRVKAANWQNVKISKKSKARNRWNSKTVMVDFKHNSSLFAVFADYITNFNDLDSKSRSELVVYNIRNKKKIFTAEYFRDRSIYLHWSKDGTFINIDSSRRVVQAIVKFKTWKEQEYRVEVNEFSHKINREGRKVKIKIFGQNVEKNQKSCVFLFLLFLRNSALNKIQLCTESQITSTLRRNTKLTLNSDSSPEVKIMRCCYCIA